MSPSRPPSTAASFDAYDNIKRPKTSPTLHFPHSLPSSYDRKSTNLDAWESVRRMIDDQTGGSNGQQRKPNTSTSLSHQLPHTISIPRSSTIQSLNGPVSPFVTSPPLEGRTPSILLGGQLSNEPNEFEDQLDNETSSDSSDDDADSDITAAHEPITHAAASLHASKKVYWKDRIIQRITPKKNYFLVLATVPTWKNILKCSTAYFIGSLFTFYPPFAEFLGAPLDYDGPVPNGHFIATIAVYYNPAKDIGAMLEADLFMIWAALFSAVVSLGSIATSVVLTGAGFLLLSHLIILVFWLSGSMGLIAYIKTQIGNPTLGSACSMATLINSIILCREGTVHVGIFELDAIAQMFIIVALGTLISNVVCFTLWRTSATTKLQSDMSRSLDSFATLIDLLTKTFLPRSNIKYTDTRIRQAMEAHHSSFTSLQTDLDAAKLEFFDSRIQRQMGSYERATASMKRLAQHLSGLRSGCSLLHNFIQEKTKSDSDSPQDDNSQVNFEAFEERVGPSLDNLVIKCRKVLKVCERSFMYTKSGVRSRSLLYAEAAAEVSQVALNSTSAYNHSVTSNQSEFSPHGLSMQERLHNVTQELHQANAVFNSVLNHDFKKMYSQPPIKYLSLQGKSGSPNEQILILYFFLFNVQQFIEEVMTLSESFCEIRAEEERLEKEKIAAWHYFGMNPPPLSAPYHNNEKLKGRAYRLLLTPLVNFMLLIGRFDKNTRESYSEHRKGTKRDLSKRFVNLWQRFAILLTFGKTRESPFPPLGDAAFTSHAVNSKNFSRWTASKRFVWKFGQVMKKSDVRFALKTGVGAGLLAFPAFWHQTRPFWLEFRMEWAMISYMVVVAITVGQTNFNAFYRIFGTLLGGVVALFVYEAFGHQPIILAIFGFFFSIPCFYVIVTRPKYATSGRFVLLTYNLVCLYAYNKRDERAFIWDIAFHRITAVVIGVAWGWIITYAWWPIEARTTLRKGLSEFFIHCAYFYEKLEASPSMRGRHHQDNEDDYVNEDTLSETRPLLQSVPRQQDSYKKYLTDMELDLRVSLINLGKLLEPSRNEPRLKGPFPVESYRIVIQNCQNLLDQLHAMRIVTDDKSWAKAVQKELVAPANKERKEMVGNILLYFSILASAVALKTPMPAYMPAADKAHARFLEKSRQLISDDENQKYRASSKYILYFAYALAVKDLIQGTVAISDIFHDLFGVLGGRRIDGLFNTPEICIHNPSLSSSLSSSSSSSSSSNDSL